MLRVVSRITYLLIVFGMLVAVQLPLISAARAEGNSPDDTPVPFATDAVEEWSVGNGLVYWAFNCFADEFVSTAALKRKPVSGSIVRTLESIDDAARCDTYLSQLSSSDGLYYYDESQKRIERMPLGEPFTPQEIKPLTGNQSPVFTSPLKEANGFLYSDRLSADPAHVEGRQRPGRAGS